MGFSASSLSIDNSTLKFDEEGKVYVNEDALGFNVRSIAEHEIELIELQANATVTPFTHDDLISDTFSDSNGYNNSVQTASSTADYDSVNKKYFLQTITTLPTISQSGSPASNKSGQKITMKVNGTLKKITKVAVSSVTKAYLYASDASTELASASFSGNDAVFNYALVSGTTYWLFVDQEGAAYTDKYQGSLTFPLTYSAFNVIQARDAALNLATTAVYAIQSVTLDRGAVIDVSLGTITGTVIATELVCNCPNRETGDNVTYKLKNATQSDDALVINAKSDLVNLTTNPTGIEIQLSPKSSSPSAGVPSVKSYCLKIWKA